MEINFIWSKYFVAFFTKIMRIDKCIRKKNYGRISTIEWPIAILNRYIELLYSKIFDKECMLALKNNLRMCAYYITVFVVLSCKMLLYLFCLKWQVFFYKLINYTVSDWHLLIFSWLITATAAGLNGDQPTNTTTYYNYDYNYFDCHFWWSSRTTQIYFGV